MLGTWLIVMINCVLRSKPRYLLVSLWVSIGLGTCIFIENRYLSYQVAEVLRRRLKSKASASSESSVKLQNTEARLTELKSTAVALGREATAAMLSVEAQQQQMTFQKLLTMVLLLTVFDNWTFLCWYILVGIYGYK